MNADLKPWYLSKTVWGGVLAIVASLANLAGLGIGSLEQAELADHITALLAAAGGIVAIAGRIVAQRKLK
ncbi:hypothetical protein J2Y48_002518 [Mycoplana sp. BE70]|uniref:hypothetical protein n=1 Tax=Mycoplana sp. BE70 TaxID=2817775 RepID=UPI002862CF8D|nr:hypothetical protein [Mycoplana sp. BE70]MDR6757222.1 hypothetical protein [Mycoplana sp. BE70]